jgi:hypothetical protein
MSNLKEDIKPKYKDSLKYIHGTYIPFRSNTPYI